MKVAFIDHAFHKKTGSGNFLRNLFISRGYEIEDFWDDEEIDYKKLKTDTYTIVFFFQHLPTAKHIKEIEAPVIWAPMYDSILGTPNYIFIRYLFTNLKILSFSESITKRFLALGFDVLSVKYFIKPFGKDCFDSKEELRLFLWQRREIDFKYLKKHLDLSAYKKITLLVSTDPGFKESLPTKKEINKFNIDIRKGHLSQKDYYRLYDECNVFVSPRKTEGIGMSFLEAMAKGKLVIAKKFPTMSEYIKDGYNGVFFKDKEKIRFSLTEFATMIANTRKKCNDGYNNWCKSEDSIVRYSLSYPKRISVVKILFAVLYSIPSTVVTKND